jgi:hypothetical protein
VLNDAPVSNRICTATAGYGMEDTHLLQFRMARKAIVEPLVKLKAEAKSHGNRLAHHT